MLNAPKNMEYKYLKGRSGSLYTKYFDMAVFKNICIRSFYYNSISLKENATRIYF